MVKAAVAVLFITLTHGSPALAIELFRDQTTCLGIMSPFEPDVGVEIEADVKAILPFVTTPSGTLNDIAPIFGPAKFEPEIWNKRIDQMSLAELDTFLTQYVFPEAGNLLQHHFHHSPIAVDPSFRTVKRLLFKPSTQVAGTSVHLGPALQPYVQLQNIGEDSNGRGIEFHIKSRDAVVNIVSDVYKFLGLTGTTDFAAHFHLRGRVPVQALRAGDGKHKRRASVFLTYQAALANTLADMGMIVLNNQTLNDDPGHFGFLGDEDLFSLLRYFAGLAKGEEFVELAPTALKMGSVGIRAHGTYHPRAPRNHASIANLDWGWEYRAFDPKGNVPMQVELLTSLRRRIQSLAALRELPGYFNDWYSKKFYWSDPEISPVDQFHYNWDWSELPLNYGSAPFRSNGVRDAVLHYEKAYARDLPSGLRPQSHHEIKMLLFDWQNSPYGFLVPESAKKMDELRLPALLEIYQQKKDPVQVVRRVLIESGIFEALLNNEI